MDSETMHIKNASSVNMIIQLPFNVTNLCNQLRLLVVKLLSMR